MKVRVYLATTEGPVEVERLTREQAQQSAVCLKRTAKLLAISSDYDAFVKQPSGVIEREFGPFAPGAFRLDVSAQIGDGDSWQIGVFAAHLLAEAGMLATPEDKTDAAVWLTGRVNNDLRVGGVGHVAEKLHASRDEFAALLGKGVPVTLFLPRGGRQTAAMADLPQELRLVEVDSTADLCRELGLDARTKALVADRTEASGPISQTGRLAIRRRKRHWRWAGPLAVFLAVAGVSAILTVPVLLDWRQRFAAGGFVERDQVLTEARQGEDLIRRLLAMVYESWFAATLPGADQVQVMVHERRPPDGRTCAAVHFRNVEAVTVPVPRGSATGFSPSAHEGLCGLEFTVVVRGRPLYAAALLRVTSGRYLEAGPRPDFLAGAKPFDGRQAWAIDLPWRLRAPFAYRLDVVAASYPVSEALGLLPAQADSARVADHLARRGVRLLSSHHRVTP